MIFTLEKFKNEKIPTQYPFTLYCFMASLTVKGIKCNDIKWILRVPRRQNSSLHERVLGIINNNNDNNNDDDNNDNNSL